MPNKNVLRICALSFLIVIQIGCSQNIKSSDTTINSASEKISGDFAGCLIGAFVDGNANISSYEDLIGRKLAVNMWFLDFTLEFPLNDANETVQRGGIPCITWEPWKAQTQENLFPLKNIASGSFDAYINRWASQAKDFKYPIFIRFGHEMNGDWYPWGQKSEYKDAYKHIVDIFKNVGAKNVSWVWNVNASPSDISNYFPGKDYVDWIGIDGYNWGTSQSGKTWQDFDSIFSSMYSDIQNTYPDKPIMIGEMACAEVGGKKSEWILDAFSKIKNKYKKIKLYNWFNINKEADWRVNSSSESLSAFKDAMSDKSFFLEKR